ncbi:MAG: DNA polymerase III subunit alpha [Nocardioidaceae bacterium]
MDPFVHLHVASGYSLKYAGSHPHRLVQRAVEADMDTLALTDRDGVYGAVRFAKACMSHGVRPILGVDLATEPSGLVVPGYRVSDSHPLTGARMSPARGGPYRDHDRRHPRVTLLAGSKAGWAALCRLVSATHLRGERGVPVATRELIREHLCDLTAGHDMVLMLGPTSELGWAATLRRDDLARAVLRDWQDVTDPANLFVEVVSHRSRGVGPGSSSHAARMAGVATSAGYDVVLTNAVRYADRCDAPAVDILDSVRRLVPLDLRHVDRANAEGFLKTGKEMADLADEICRFAGFDSRAADRLVARTRVVADRCAVDPRADLGLGEVHFPEFDITSAAAAGAASGDAVLRARCDAGIGRRYAADQHSVVRAVAARLDAELSVIAQLGYSAYFLTVADVVDLIQKMGVRVAARGSGAGSLVNYLLGISGVDPLRYGLLMERFLSPLRQALPDIDIDVESARRTEVYEQILANYTGNRCAAVSMMDTYRVRHAIRDVGAALGMPPGEIDSIAKAFPHIRAKDARAALSELPELQASGLDELGLEVFFGLVERLDGLPRHIAVHPCGVLLSDATLLDRTPVEASYLGFPMSQFDKDDVEDLGLLKLDVLGIRMQSAMAHAIDEISRVHVVDVDIDDETQVPRDDPATYTLIQSTKTLGCFQIESPGQRELVGKFAPETFEDIIIDISLFRPGPVKSDMVNPFLRVRQGWTRPEYLHPDLEPVLAQTCGVVVFHEQVVEMIATFTGCTLAEADEARRGLGDREGKEEVKVWFFPRAMSRGYSTLIVRRVWEVLEAFASFGFCKAHAAAFALPTYQSAWLKAHHPAAFLAGVLTHDPGMYPKRLILDDARQFGIAVLPLDVNSSDDVYRVEKVGIHDEPPPQVLGRSPRLPPESGLPDGRAYGIRLSLRDVKGISDAEVASLIAARPFHSLTDLWQRAHVSRPIAERLVLAGGLDAIYGIGSSVPVRRRGTVTRRDLLLQVVELDRWSRATDRAVRAASPRRRPRARSGADQHEPSTDPRELAAGQSQAAKPVAPVGAVQLTLDLGDTPALSEASGLPEMSGAERVRAELEILGLDVSHHVVDFYAPMLEELKVTWSGDLLRRRSRSELLVAGVKVATQTPPIRSGRRVVFLTLDDGTGPIDATFFEDAQGPYAATLFHSWLLVVRGELRRTGPRGVSLRATGCWELPVMYDAWQRNGLVGAHQIISQPPLGFDGEQAAQGAAESRSTRPVMARAPSLGSDEGEGGATAGGMGRRRVLVHPSGFKQSPYSDIRPAGVDTKSVPRKLWHSSPGSAG